MPLLSMCDRGDAGGISVLADRYARIPLIVLYDGYTGGTGITELAFERIDELATIAWDMVSGCDCESGCPRCVYDRSCGSGNEPMNRPRCGAHSRESPGKAGGIGAVTGLRDPRQSVSGAKGAAATVHAGGESV